MSPRRRIFFPAPARRRATVAALAVLWALPAARAARAPDWLEAAARTPVTVATKDADAVLLLNEGCEEIDRDGERTIRLRRVFKVLTADGKKHAVAQVGYLSGSSAVKSFKAWTVRPGGEVIAYARKETADLAVHAAALELYGEARQQVIAARDDVAPGAVFGFESVVVGRTLFHQEAWVFQTEVPTERSVFALRVPPDWKVTERMVNHAPVAATVADATRTWSLAALPAFADEPMSPPARSLAPWLALDFQPPAKDRAATTGLAVGSWEFLSRYFTPKFDAAAQADDALRARVGQLLAGAATPWERLQRLCNFVQQVNYISILLDAANAGGFIPRPAARVLQCNYGDCKDKATLLRALLAVAGIKAYPLVVLAGGRSRLESDWPAPGQFNHCILAIEVDDSVRSLALVEHPKLGRLLVFDPTDPFTPLGLLYRSRLADQGLLLAGETGGLIALPAARPEGDRVVRVIHAQLDGLGNLRGRIEERFSGIAASGVRRERQVRKEGDFQKYLEHSLAATLPALREVKVRPQDRFPEAEFVLDLEFISLGYGKLMRDELLTFKPVLVSRRAAFRLTKKPRLLPVAVPAQSYEERAEFTLPEDCTVDEAGAPLQLETDFGRYRSSARVVDGKLLFERSLELKELEVPAADYEKVRVFFEKIARSEQAPVVLRRAARVAPAGPEKVAP
ncbi:MAG: DUF3857 domain-containing protein [Opitutae bacterium]|nr:DUF3857 domain-containing protein [Opitutae bacterium]